MPATLLHISDEPGLELKVFQLGSARDLFPFSLKSKIGKKRAEIFIF